MRLIDADRLKREIIGFCNSVPYVTNRLGMTKYIDKFIDEQPEQEQCGECSCRKWYQKGYEDAKRKYQLPLPKMPTASVSEYIKYYPMPDTLLDPKYKRFWNPADTLEKIVKEACETIPNEAVKAVANGDAEWETEFKITDHGAEAITRLKWKVAEE